MNVYEMVIDNGGCGFWVRRRGWADNFAARVVAVGPLAGPAPYYGNPSVLAEFFRDGQLVSVGELSSPGTYRYARLNSPTE